MIRQLVGASLLLNLCLSAQAQNPQRFKLGEQELQHEVQFSQSISKQLAGSLKQRLMNAVKSGGLAGGIEQCKIAAPEISQYLEEKYSSKLISAGRTSLKIRNPQNLPDTWQKTQLQIFDQEQNKGLQPSYRYRVIQQEGRPVLEYISPIPTQGLCLNCHGEVLNMEVTETLRDLYPEDQARGYKAGDIRGAFIIRSWLDKSTTGMKK